jgi:pimeloyl-ACP methyl ester carboxylesterase
MTGPSEREVPFPGGTGIVQTGGSGPDLVVLHDDIGSPGWLPFHEALAARFRVTVPTLPGWGNSARPEWARDARDIAILTRQLLSALDLGPTNVIGLGFGGWLAAEIATMSPATWSRIVLVAPAGLKPQSGEYLDQFMVSAVEYVRAGFHDQSKFDAQYGAEPDIERLETWELNREMTTRIGWSPYMYSQALPHLLPGVAAPTLVVRGSHDRIVPPGCAEEFARCIPGARLETVDNCGHYVDIEQPEALAKLASAFFGSV